MLKDRSELEQHLKVSIEQIRYKKRDIEKINTFLYEYGIPVGTINEIAKNNQLLSELSVTYLCLITIALYEVLEVIIRPDDYFTEREIQEAKNYKEEKVTDIILPVTLENVLQLDYENYITKIKMTELVKWFNAKLIVYDFETQRSPVLKKVTDGGVVPVPWINQESVKSIAEHMVNETYLPDTLTLNVYSNESDPLIYNPKTKSLTINEGAVISILDGFHRLQAGMRAAMINPELQLEMNLSIKSYDTETAKKYFGQINTVNVVNRQRLEELKQEKVSYESVKILQRSSDLKGRIYTGVNVRMLSTTDFLTTTGILADAIQMVFEPKMIFEAREVGNYLAEFFNYLMGQYNTEFTTDLEKIRETSYLAHRNSFIGYVALAKRFKDENIPLNNIREVLDVKIDMSKNNNDLENRLLQTTGTPLHRTRKIIEYFNKINLK